MVTIPDGKPIRPKISQSKCTHYDRHKTEEYFLRIFETTDSKMADISFVKGCQKRCIFRGHHDHRSHA